MLDERTKQSMEFLDWWVKGYGLPQDDITAQRDLEQAIGEYLLWMGSEGYSHKTIKSHRRELNRFLIFIKKRRFCWDEIFTLDTLKWFQKVRALKWVHGVRGLSQYLFEQGKIAEPIPTRKAPVKLPDIYEQYLAYHKQSQQACARKIKSIRRVLAAFHEYLQGSKTR